MHAALVHQCRALGDATQKAVGWRRHCGVEVTGRELCACPPSMCHSYGGREELKVKCRMIVIEGRKEERAQMRAPRARPEMLAAGQDVAVG